MYYDILIFIGLGISLLAQIIVTTSYSKYKKVQNSKNITGFEVARKILDKNGLQDIMILETKGNLNDHYDPTRKVIKLSTDIYHGTSIAGASVAAHECGHAIQDKVGYKPMRIRSKIVPTVNICTKLGYIAIAIGAIFSYQLYNLIEIGIILLATILVFELITLPVEFNASKRALEELDKLKLIEKEENRKAKNMLSAAAFTYVASLITSFLQILRLVLMFSRRND